MGVCCSHFGTIIGTQVLGYAQSLEEEWPQLTINEPGYRGIYLYIREVYRDESLLNFDSKGKYLALDIYFLKR